VSGVLLHFGLQQNTSSAQISTAFRDDKLIECNQVNERSRDAHRLRSFKQILSVLSRRRPHKTVLMPQWRRNVLLPMVIIARFDRKCRAMMYGELFVWRANCVFAASRVAVEECELTAVTGGTRGSVAEYSKRRPGSQLPRVETVKTPLDDPLSASSRRISLAIKQR